jgi:nitrite reductase (NADH) small subunit
MSNWIEIGKLEDIPPLGTRVVRIADEAVGIFRTADDRVFALRDRCPHRGGPLSQGIVFGTQVACPLHDWVIDLETGQAVGPDEGCVATYPVRVEQGRVLLLPVADAASAGATTRQTPAEA